MAKSSPREAAPRKAAQRKSSPPPAAVASAPAATPVVLGRVSKGKRPQFHDQAAVDQLFAVVTALTGEVSVAFDRIDTLERVLAAAGGIRPDAVESYQPDAAAADARGVKREALIQRVFAVFDTDGAARRR